MANHRHFVAIPESSLTDNRTILTEPPEGGLFFSGSDVRDPFWHCVECDNLLASHIPRARLGGVVIKCVSCGTFNDTATTI